MTVHTEKKPKNTIDLRLGSQTYRITLESIESESIAFLVDCASIYGTIKMCVLQFGSTCNLMLVSDIIYICFYIFSMCLSGGMMDNRFRNYQQI